MHRLLLPRAQSRFDVLLRGFADIVATGHEQVSSPRLGRSVSPADTRVNDFAVRFESIEAELTLCRELPGGGDGFWPAAVLSERDTVVLGDFVNGTTGRWDCPPPTVLNNARMEHGGLWVFAIAFELVHLGAELLLGAVIVDNLGFRDFCRPHRVRPRF